MQLKPIDQQVVVLVGASSGIGRETALQFARRGARVVVAARSAPGLQSLVQEIRGAGGSAAAVTADVAELDQVQAIAERAVAEYGRIDTWVHLAAVALYATFVQTTPEEFKRVVDVNLMGQVYGAMVALPHLRRAGGGALIHVSSVEAKRAFPFHSAYAAAKHGVDGFVEAMRVELQREGVPVSVTQILPASINTPLFTKACTKIGVKPMGAPPIYQPNVVADAILYAAEHPVRDVIVGGSARAIIQGQQLSPALMDAVLARVGFEAQMTDEPRGEDTPNNLYEPVPEYDRVEGDFSDQARPVSLYTSLQTHPQLRNVMLAGALLATAAMLQSRTARQGDGSSSRFAVRGSQ